MPIHETVKKAAKTAASTATEAFSTASETAANVGEKAVKAASSGVSKVASAAQKKHQESLLARYNPVFPNEFLSPNYDLPNLIIIEDGDSRKDIDVCKGAIGWLSKTKGMEVLHLYEEAVAFSNLCFYPIPKIDSAYYVDSLGGDRFLDLDSYHEVIQKEKMTELKNIARSLGAKECYLETYEEDRSYTKSKRSADVSIKPTIMKNTSGSADQQVNSEHTQKRSIMFKQVFEGSANPIRPELNYFKNDSEILSLIDSRCGKDNQTKEYSFQLDTSSSSAMSITTAMKIDSALKVAKVKASSTFMHDTEQESKRKFIFHINF